MAKPKLSSKTPDDPITNALIDQHPEILASPNTRRIAIVEFTTSDVHIKPSTGDQAAQMQIVHIELMHGADQEAAEKLFTKVHFNRTGNKTRPNPGEAPKPLGEPLPGMEGLDDSVE